MMKLSLIFSLMWSLALSDGDGGGMLLRFFPQTRLLIPGAPNVRMDRNNSFGRRSSQLADKDGSILNMLKRTDYLDLCKRRNFANGDVQLSDAHDPAKKNLRMLRALRKMLFKM